MGWLGRSVVVKVSGGLLSPARPGYIARLASALREARDAGYRLAVVVGGGSLARERIAALRELGVAEAMLDMVGIWASRLNALTLAAALYPTSPLRVPVSIDEALDYVALGLVPVMGGLQPGQSTNAVAAALAEAMGAPLVNMLRGVPGVMLGGRPAERLSYGDLEGVIEGKDQVAGGYELFDKVALEIVRRSGVKVYFIDGEDPSRLTSLLLEGRLEGTLVE